MNYRVNKREKFTQIENDTLRDENLSMEGLALLVRLLSRSDNWRSNISELVKNGKNGGWTDGAVKRGFKNLAKNGYAKLVKIYNIDSNSMEGSYYEIFEDKEQSKYFPNTIYVDSNNNEVEKQTRTKQTCQLSDTSETQAYIYIDHKNKENNNIILSNETDNKQGDNVCLNVSNNINSGDCTFQGNNCIKEVSKKKPSKYDQNPERFKFINEKTKEWNATANESIKIRSPRKGEKESNNWIIGKLYDTFGQEKAEIIFNYVMSKGQYRQPHGLLNQINVQNALASYQDPNDEQPRFMNRDEFKYMERTYGKDYDLPQQGDFFKEEPYYAALEWYFSRENSPNEVVKKTREITSKNLKYKNY